MFTTSLWAASELQCCLVISGICCVFVYRSIFRDFPLSGISSFMPTTFVFYLDFVVDSFKDTS